MAARIHELRAEREALKKKANEALYKARDEAKAEKRKGLTPEQTAERAVRGPAHRANAD